MTSTKKSALIIGDYGKKSVRKYTAGEITSTDDLLAKRVLKAFSDKDHETLLDILYCELEDTDSIFLCTFNDKDKTISWSLKPYDGSPERKGKCKINSNNVLEDTDEAIAAHNKLRPPSDYVLIRAENANISGCFEVPGNIDMGQIQFEADGISSCMGPWVIDANYKKVFSEKVASVSCFKYNGKYYFGDIEEGFAIYESSYALAKYDIQLKKWKIVKYLKED